jgi:hypothetical protein
MGPFGNEGGKWDFGMVELIMRVWIWGGFG